jgi:creatinine amidohydrolase
VVRPGCSDHHLAFPGSLSIPSEVFIETVVGYVRSLAPHGFTTFVLLSSHGGNFSALETAAKRLRVEYEPKGIRIIDLSGQAAIHADVTETSVMMLRHPALVATDRLEAGFLGRIDAQDLWTRGLRAFTPSGIIGDPRRASADLGEAVVEALASHVTDLVRRQTRAADG